MTRLRVLSIAGSDSGGGAGIQADLKTMAAHGVYGMTAVTAVTAQNTVAVTGLEAVSPALVAAQIDAVLEDLGVDAVKIGMLASASIVEVVAQRLGGLGNTPIVLDPVMVSKSGAALLSTDAVEVLRERLLPLATLVTPNLPEMEALVPGLGPGAGSRRRAMRHLGMAGPAVLLKGGHGEGPVVEDLLLEGDEMHRFAHRRIETMATHGTGCTLSTAIACRLAGGETLPDAVAAAIGYVQRAMEEAAPMGRGSGPLDHLVSPG